MNDDPSPKATEAPTEPTEAPLVAPLVAPLEVAPIPPPAATIVAEGPRNEREVALERDLKQRETRLAELEDENRRLKVVTHSPKAEKAKKGWLSGATFFPDED